MYYEWYIRSTDTGDAADLERRARGSTRRTCTTGGPVLWPHRSGMRRRHGPGPHPRADALSPCDMDVPDGETVPTVRRPRTSTTRACETFPYRSRSCTRGPASVDAFPEIGIIEPVNLGRNSIRFDQSRNISPPDHEHYYNVSLTIDVVAVAYGLRADRSSADALQAAAQPAVLLSHRAAGLAAVHSCSPYSIPSFYSALLLSLTARYHFIHFHISTFK